MGGTCCKATFNPNKVHIKKINEIFINYLKNQGIDTTQKVHSKGSEEITPKIHESVTRHAKNSCKDLVSLMQINSKFITRICTVLTKRVTEPTYSAELRLLGLVLLKELVQYPLVKRVSRFSRYANLKSLKQQIGMRNSSPSSASSGYPNSGAPHSQGQQSNITVGTTIHGYPSELIFSIMNEKMIFKTLQEVITSSRKGDVLDQNQLFITLETFQIFNHLLTTMIRLSLLENEAEYLNFIEPFIDESSPFTKSLQQYLAGGLENNLITQNSQQILATQSILIDAYRSYFKIIQQMKETSFRSRFSLLLRMVWSQVVRSEVAIESERQVQNKQDQSLSQSEEGKIELDDIILKNRGDEEEVKGEIQQKINLKIIQANDSEIQQLSMNQSQLYLTGFEMIRHLSHRLSSDAGDLEEYYHTFVQTVFEYFENNSQLGWSALTFAKLIFFIIVNNNAKFCGDLSFEVGPSAFLDELTKDWNAIFRNLASSSSTDLFQNALHGSRRYSKASQNSSSRQDQAGGNEGENESFTDYTMLVIVLDYFIQYLTKGIMPDKASAPPKSTLKQSEAPTPHHDDQKLGELFSKKRDMVEIMCELMQLLQPDTNIHQFDESKLVDAIIQIIVMTSVNQHQLISTPDADFDRQFRICIEIYMSKVKNIERLLEILEKTMTFIQEELLGTNEVQIFTGRFNYLKVNRLMNNLILPTLFFLKRLQEEEAALGIKGVQSSNKKGDLNGKALIARPLKIKENHMVLMLNLAKKAVEDGETGLVEQILNTQISMQVISEDLMQINQHKVKGFSKDFIQRYLSGIAELIKVNQARIHIQDDFTTQIFSIWKFFLNNMDKKSSEVLTILYAFVIHLQQVIYSGVYESKLHQARDKLLFHFILCSFSISFQVQPLLEQIQSMKSANQISDAFWFMLPMIQNRESLSIYLQKLENLLLDLNQNPVQMIQESMKLQLQLGGKSLLEILESHLESMISPLQSNFPSLKQRLESFKLMDQQQRTNTVSQLQESTKKTPLLYDFNQKFLVESFDATSLIDQESENEVPLRMMDDMGMIQVEEDPPRTQIYKLEEQPKFNNKRRDKLLERSLCSDLASFGKDNRNDSLQRVDSVPQSAVIESPNEIKRGSMKKMKLVIKHGKDESPVSGRFEKDTFGNSGIKSSRVKVDPKQYQIEQNL